MYLNKMDAIGFAIQCLVKMLLDIPIFIAMPIQSIILERQILVRNVDVKFLWIVVVCVSIFLLFCCIFLPVGVWIIQIALTTTMFSEFMRSISPFNRIVAIWILTSWT